MLFASRIRKFDGLPGPTPKFPLGTIGEFKGKNAWEVCADYGTTYGPCTLIWLGPKPALVLNDAALIQQVLETDRDNYYKKDPRTALLPVITDKALFLANGQEWKTFRSNHAFCQHFFTDWLDQQVDPISRIVKERSESWAGSTIDLVPRFKRMAFDAFSQSSIGQQLSDDLYQRWAHMGNVGSHRMTSLLSFIPPIRPSFYAAKKQWYETFAKIIQDAVAAPNAESKDLLNTVIAAGFDLSGKNGPGKIDFTNLYMGGCFSASSVLITAFYLLAQHPESGEKLKQEVGALPPVNSLTQTEIDQCVWLDAVTREAMRFISPVPLYFRNSNPTQSVKLGNCSLPPDTMLFITNRHLHREANHWKNANEFRPERWLDGGVEDDPIGSGHFFPFGLGPRMCVGWQFAMLYMKTALATLIQSSELQILANQPYEQELYFGVMLPKGLRAKC